MKNIVSGALLVARFLMARPLTALLNVLLLALGLACVTRVLLVSTQLERAFARDVAGIDLVVGAKGSPLQLVLSGVFHLDSPTGNVPLKAVRALEKDPRVAGLIPMSLGDSFRGHRIVGTTPEYLAHFSATFAEGTVWTRTMQVVLGADVAKSRDMVLRATFVGSHGLGDTGQKHGAAPYRVVGMLAPCGCVLDRLILTSLESVWHVHDDSVTGDDDAHDAKALATRDVTLALVRYTSPLAAASLPRWVNTETPMQAASPALEITRLLQQIGVGADLLRGVGVLLLLMAALGVFMAFWSAVRERRDDLALLRLLGASPLKLAALLAGEALALALGASLLGLAGGHGLAALLGLWLAQMHSVPVTGWLWLPQEWWVPALAGALALVAAALPMANAYRVDAGELLHGH